MLTPSNNVVENEVPRANVTNSKSCLVGWIVSARIFPPNHDIILEPQFDVPHNRLVAKLIASVSLGKVAC